MGAVAGQLSATGVIRGVTVTEAAIRAHHRAGGIVGYTYGDVADCTVDGLTLTLTLTPELVGDIYDNGDKAGGIVGYLSNGDVTGCTVKNAEIFAFRDLGGLVGNATVENTAPVVSDNTVENLTLGFTESDGEIDAEHANMGALIGRKTDANATLDVDDIEEENNTVRSVVKIAAPETFAAVLASGRDNEVIFLTAGTYAFTDAAEMVLDQSLIFRGEDGGSDLAVVEE